jgi:hypothetical protein
MKYLIRNVWIGNSSDNMYGGGTWRDWADADNKNTPDINKARVYDDAQGGRSQRQAAHPQPGNLGT